MKIKQTIFCFLTVSLVSMSIMFTSCAKDEFTIENQDVTGDFTYVMTSFIPLSFDSAGVVPLSARITMEGPGTVTDMGELYVVSTFKFDFIGGTGSEFITTYTGASTEDSFKSDGSSQRQPDGSIVLTEELNSGTGKFAKISGGGTTIVLLNAAGDAGTGEAMWKITY